MMVPSPSPATNSGEEHRASECPRGFFIKNATQTVYVQLRVPTVAAAQKKKEKGRGSIHSGSFID